MFFIAIASATLMLLIMSVAYVNRPVTNPRLNPVRNVLRTHPVISRFQFEPEQITGKPSLRTMQALTVSQAALGPDPKGWLRLTIGDFAYEQLAEIGDWFAFICKPTPVAQTVTT